MRITAKKGHEELTIYYKQTRRKEAFKGETYQLETKRNVKLLSLFLKLYGKHDLTSLLQRSKR